MARIAGVDLPPKKRAEIGLTYIYGIGRTRAKSSCSGAASISTGKSATSPKTRSICPYHPRRGRFGRRRSAQRNLAEHQAADRDGLLSRSPSSPRAARSRPAHPYQLREPARDHAAAPSPTRRKQQRRPRLHGQSSSEIRNKKKTFKKKEKKSVPVGLVHVQATFNNTIVTFTDPIGNVLAWSSSGSLGFRGSRKERRSQRSRLP